MITPHPRDSTNFRFSYLYITHIIVKKIFKPAGCFESIDIQCVFSFLWGGSQGWWWMEGI